MISAQTSVDPDNSSKRLPHGLMHGALCLSIIIQYLYLFSFNVATDSIRLLFSGSLTVMHLGMAAFTIMVRPASWNLVLLASGLLVFMTWIPTDLIGLGKIHQFRPVAALRDQMLPLMMIWILAYPLALPITLLRCCAIVFTLLGAAIALIGDPVYLADGPRLASITGGPDEIHASAKFMALQLVLLDQLRRGSLIHSRLAWSLIILSVVVLAGYGGKNELLFIFCYYMMLIYYQFKHERMIEILPFIVITISAILAVIVLQIGIAEYGWSRVSGWGSGRIGVWWYRLDLISKSDLMTLLFGGGEGADKIWTPEWWWNEEGMSAHNDYLHIMMERGFFGLMGCMFFLYGIWLRLSNEGRAVVAAMTVNSFFANGFFQSPLLSMSLAIALSTTLLVCLISCQRELMTSGGRHGERTSCS